MASEPAHKIIRINRMTVKAYATPFEGWHGMLLVEGKFKKMLDASEVEKYKLLET